MGLVVGCVGGVVAGADGFGGLEVEVTTPPDEVNCWRRIPCLFFVNCCRIVGIRYCRKTWGVMDLVLCIPKRRHRKSHNDLTQA